MGVDFIGAVIGFVLTIFVFSRTSTLKEYAKVRFTLSNTPQKKGIFSKFNHKREVKKENKLIKGRDANLMTELTIIGMLVFFCSVFGFYGFALPGVVLVANASGMRIPAKVPLLGKFSADLDIYWNKLVANDITMLTGVTGEFDKKLLRRQEMTKIPIINRFVKKTRAVHSLENAQKAEQDYLLMLIKHFLLTSIPGLLLSLIIAFSSGSTTQSDIKIIVKQILIFLFAGMIICIVGISLLKKAVRENPMLRTVTI